VPQLLFATDGEGMHHMPGSFFLLGCFGVAAAATLGLKIQQSKLHTAIAQAGQCITQAAAASNPAEQHSPNARTLYYNAQHLATSCKFIVLLNRLPACCCDPSFPFHLCIRHMA
jgi:hypothetical protein